ncbi:hypothetical protein BDK51DRAFT_27163 [Blyttiomyces helicus]|uniref:Uncharacterized protein n=1 Tax=Blyttiomyces helicus TaxID=388810 RepID=A0A4P9WKI3_9FUNG|nr:hypothetical protein BDK51DRAFT_27163 [Blyttiomyces helicus]|eukprot:RKO92635.1 hypothetical protein BDK51DRAFT_27163 [Blyttiomyces helicus]
MSTVAVVHPRLCDDVLLHGMLATRAFPDVERESTLAAAIVIARVCWWWFLLAIEVLWERRRFKEVARYAHDSVWLRSKVTQIGPPHRDEAKFLGSYIRALTVEIDFDMDAYESKRHQEIERKLDNFDNGYDERARDPYEARLERRRPQFKMNIDLDKIFSAFHCPRLKAFTFVSPLPPSSWPMLSFPFLFQAIPDLVALDLQLSKAPSATGAQITQFWGSAGARAMEAAAARLRIVRICSAVEGDHHSTAYNSLYESTGSFWSPASASSTALQICAISQTSTFENSPNTTSPAGHRALPEFNNDTFVNWVLETFPSITQLNTCNLVITSAIFSALTAHTPRLQTLRFTLTENIAEAATSKNSVSPSNSTLHATHALLDALSSACPKLASVFFGKQPELEPSRFKKWLHDAIERPGSALEHVHVAGANLTRIICDAGLRWNGLQGFVHYRLDIDEVTGIVGLD